MRGRKWWLGIVGVLHLLLGGGAIAARLFSPESAAPGWPELYANLYWLVMGVLMLCFLRAPEQATALIITIVALELFAWVPTDIAAIALGWAPLAGMAPNLIIHLVIGVAGILVIRSRGATALAPS